MNFLHSFSTIVWSLIVLKLYVLLVASEIISQLSTDPENWREFGRAANLAKFNSLYSIIIKENKLNKNGYCSGQCDNLDASGKLSAVGSEFPNDCFGQLVRCWFYQKTQERNDAKEHYDGMNYIDTLTLAFSYGMSNKQPLLKEAEFKLDHTGNLCKCLCERTINEVSGGKREELLDSLCMDPVSVDERHVVTGVRFRRHDNVIHLELQQAKLRGGRIISAPQWIPSRFCENRKLVASYNYAGGTERFKIIAEDLVLPENAAVTGVTLGESVKGRYISENGNFDERRGELTKETQCPDTMDKKSFLRDANYQDEHPRVTTSVINNYERSESCRTRIFFKETSAEGDDVKHVVPFVDLQEVVTNPPQMVHGIGWYHRGYPGYGGFFALKIFVSR